MTIMTTMTTGEAPFSRAAYADVVTDEEGRPLAGATASLFAVRAFAPGTRPLDPGAVAPLATAVTDATGVFGFYGLPPDDYHVRVVYTAPGTPPTTLWRYNVPIGPYETGRRAADHALGAAIPRTLSLLHSGASLTIVCVGDGVTTGYNAMGTPAGSWTAVLAAHIAAALPRAEVLRFDPLDYAVSLDAPIPAWTPTAVGASTPSTQQVRVVNAGVSGDSVLRVLRRLHNLTGVSWTPLPALYIVFLGIGEMSDDPTKAATPDDLAGQLSGLVDLLGADGGDVLLCTPHAGPPGADVERYAGAVRATAASLGLGVVDLRRLWNDHYDPTIGNDGQGSWLDTTAGDHVSPTDAGHKAIGDEVFRVLDPVAALPIVGAGIAEGAARETVRLLNTSALLHYTGAWSVSTDLTGDSKTASPTELHTNTPGDHVTFSAHARDLYLLTRRGHDGGRVEVFVDGADYGYVDLYRAAPSSTIDVSGYGAGALAPRERLALALDLPDLSHVVTLRLRPDSSSPGGATVWRLDALDLVRLRHGGGALEGSEPLQLVQHGTVVVSLTGAAAGTASIVFARSFAGAMPVVTAQSPNPDYYTAVSAITATGATVTLVQYAHGAVTDTQVVSWLALG